MRQRIPWVLAAVAALGAFLYLGRSAAGEHGPNNPRDAEIFHVAGTCWLHLESPHEREAWMRNFERARARYPELRGRPNYTQVACFAYPPTVIPFTAPFALFPYPVARRVFAAVNVAAWLMLCVLAVQLWSEPAGWRSPRLLVFLGLAGFASQALPQTLWHGQIGLLALTCSLGAFWAWRHDRVLLGSLLVMLASAKPQIAALPLFYLMLVGGHRIVLLGASLAIVFSGVALALLPGPLTESTQALLEAYRAFRSFSTFDSLDNYYSIPGIFGRMRFAHGVMVGGVVFGALAMTGLAVLRRLGKPSPEGERPRSSQSGAVSPLSDWRHHLVLSLAATVALMPLHPYDLVMIAALAASLPVFRWPSGRLIALLVLFIAGRSQNLQRMLLGVIDPNNGIDLHFLPHCLSASLLVVFVALWAVDIRRFRLRAKETPSSGDLLA